MNLFSRASLGLYFMRLVAFFINTVLTIHMYLDTFVSKISQVISSDGNYECNKTLFRWCIHSDSFMNTSFGMITYVLFIFSCGNNFSSQYKRPDRDNSVTFYPQHLEGRCKHEFNKMTIDPYPGNQTNHISKGLESWVYFWPKTVISIRNKLISTKKGTFVKASEN